MRRRKFITLFGAATAAWPLGARAQQAEKVYKIGLLTAGSDAGSLQGVLRDSLRELGWIEGKNLLFELSYAEDDLDRLLGLAAELVSLDVDVIVTVGTLAPLAANGPPRRSRSLWRSPATRWEAGSSRAWRTPAAMSPD